LPADGVYAGLLHVNGEVYTAMANLGGRPTLKSEQRKLEVHCIEIEIELYGADVKFELTHHLRDIQEFDNLDELKKQLAADKSEATRLLAQK
jgi:riboflavin kinase/FMN adenylyltransferase